MSQRRDDRSYSHSHRVQRAFALRLKRVRKAKNKFQKALAGDLGLSRTSVSNIERGMHRIFLDQVYTAARCLGVDVMELLPPMHEIYEETHVHSSADNRLSVHLTARAIEIVKNVQMDLVTTTARRRPAVQSRRKAR